MFIVRYHVELILFVPVAAGQTRDVFAGFLNLAWEIDVWGRIRRSDEAALAELFARFGSARKLGRSPPSGETSK